MSKSPTRKNTAYKKKEGVSAGRWIRDWQTRFSPLGVEIIVADVGQPSVFIDMAERKVVLAPSLNVGKADRMLAAVHEWWKDQEEEAQVVCAFA